MTAFIHRLFYLINSQGGRELDSEVGGREETAERRESGRRGKDSMEGGR